jgi:hypothetical protein
MRSSLVDAKVADLRPGCAASGISAGEARRTTDANSVTADATRRPVPRRRDDPYARVPDDEVVARVRDKYAITR